MVNTNSETATLDVQLNLLGANFKKQIDNTLKAVGKSNISAPELGDLFNVDNASKIKSMASEYNSLSDAFGANSVAAKSSRRQLDKLGQELGFTERAISKVIKKTEVMNFGFLTLLFAGQLLQKTFGAALGSISRGYTELTNKQTAFGKSATKLGANFNFLKFQIGRALDQPFVINQIEVLSDALDDFGDFLDAHPGMATFIIGIAEALVVLGTVAILASSIIQIGMLVKELGLFFALDFSKADKATKALGGLSKIKPIDVSIAIAGAVFLFEDTFEIIGDPEATLFERIADTAGWALLGGLVGGKKGFLIVGGIILTLQLLDIIFEPLSDIISKTSDKFSNFVRELRFDFKVGGAGGLFDNLFGGSSGDTKIINGVLQIVDEYGNIVQGITDESAIVAFDTEEEFLKMVTNTNENFGDMSTGFSKNMTSIEENFNKSFSKMKAKGDKGITINIREKRIKEDRSESLFTPVRSR